MQSFMRLHKRYSAFSPIITQKVHLGSKQIQIPVADLRGETAGKTIVITGGMDGDEYTGIEAAYRLIQYYHTKSFPGRIIIIPIVNMPGYENAISLNPLDYRYPKHVFPGKSNGGPTDRLMYWLVTMYISNADVWLDLHAGAITERLIPYVFAQATGSKAVDEQTKTILRAANFQRMLYEEKDTRSYASKLAKQGISYIIFESGQLGQRNEVDINRHVTWVTRAVASLHSEHSKRKPIQCYRKVHITLAKQTGRWFPAMIKEKVPRRTNIGTLKSVDDKTVQTVVAKQDGVLLWSKAVTSCQKDDILIAVASDSITL